MSKAMIRTSEDIYGVLLRFYPKRYRQEFGEEMKYVFSESLKDAYQEQGESGIISYWTRTIVDVSKSAVTQHIDNQLGGDTMNTQNTDIITQNKVFLWIALATGLILSIPLIAMQFTSEVDWKLGDFIFMGVLLFGTGFGFVSVARITPSRYRALIGLGFFLLLFVTWVHLAVGIVDTWPLAGS